VVVLDAVSDAIARARRGEGPSLLVLATYRLRGHSMADPEAYRSKDEVARYRELDPLVKVAERLKAAGRADDRSLADIAAAVDRVVEDSVRFAEESPEPSPDTLMQGIYAAPVARR
jgi:pyruvate dehydrogenase E1 component alpha subunit